MKVLFLIRNCKNKDVIDSIVINGDSFSSIQYDFNCYLDNPDVELPIEFAVESILLDCIRVIECKKIRELDYEIYL